ncbi:MAG: DNA double-strand break repair nuclease NurA [Halobacteriales archaeon]|nr:DNA double-strand break repair nuclease NurA [Halobacteriales archaeon]
MARPALASPGSWESVALAIAERLRDAPGGPLRPVAVEPQPARGLGAVDGGSALVLEGGGLAVGAVRAHALAWRAHAPVVELASPLEVRVLDRALTDELAQSMPGFDPPRSAADLVERWRGLREWELALQLADRLATGDLLALDGPVAQQVWAPGLDRALAERCAARGIGVVGVCKRASAVVGGLPALLAAKRAARGLPTPWLAPLSGSSVAVCLAPGGRVFRVDVAPGTEPTLAVGQLASWCADAGYLGYPYPLALVHNRCALDDGLVQDLSEALRGAAQARGVDPAAWDEVFGDFHDVLDRGL